MRAPVLVRALFGAVAFMLAAAHPALSQADSTLAQGGIYDRPFIGSASSTSIGGYVEGNSNYFVDEGITEGLSMELRRFNIFLFSAISPRVRFISELEFEHGTEEIALETALVDVQIRPSFTLRAGILLPPIGYLNQNHDSPRWNWIDRPLVTTGIVPSTLSEVGFGAYGRGVMGSTIVSWDAYLTNGLSDGVISNATGRTDIPSGKSEESFGEDNNGSPAISGRIGIRRPGLGEVGLSYYGARYNTDRLEGEPIDDPRRVEIAALDFGGAVGPLAVRGEFALANIDVTTGLSELSGSRQWGGHLDLVAPVLRPRVLGYTNAVLEVGLRLEFVDFNVGSFSSTGRPIRDDVAAVVPTLAYRPTPGTVFRGNYRYHWTRDFVGNPTSRMAGFQLGFATYF